MTIEKTYYGFLIRGIWNGEIRVYRLFSTNKEYSVTFMGEVLAKITLKGGEVKNDKIKIIYSRNMNVPENEIADIGSMIIDTARALN